VILVDSSGWVEYLRATGSPVGNRMREAVEGGEELATVGAVVLEVLAGARDERHAAQLGRALGHCAYVATDEPADYETAAAIYRECRRAGTTPRKMPDCLIAAVAIRTGSALLHRDSDFEAIARHAPLELLAV
jgi:predicted nucleic acid-binding protein